MTAQTNVKVAMVDPIVAHVCALVAAGTSFMFSCCVVLVVLARNLAFKFWFIRLRKKDNKEEFIFGNEL